MAIPPGAGPEHPSAPGHRAGRRRYSVWTILAPAAAVVLWIAFFSALGKSCVFKECGPERANDPAVGSSSEANPVNDLPFNARAKVKAGDTISVIAERFDLTEEELKACNPTVDPQSIQPGQYLFVSGRKCENADLAPTGANPDPLAGETGGPAAGDAASNATAEADPSAQDAGGQG